MRCVPHAGKCCLLQTHQAMYRCVKCATTELPRVIAERPIHLSSSNGWAEFWPVPMKFLVFHIKGSFILCCKWVALPHCTLLHRNCHVTALRCQRKVKLILTWNVVMLWWLVAESNRCISTATQLEMLLIPHALCWSSRKCNCACALPRKSATALARYPQKLAKICLRVKNFVKILVTAQTHLCSYGEQQRAFGNSNICNWGVVWTDLNHTHKLQIINKPISLLVAFKQQVDWLVY